MHDLCVSYTISLASLYILSQISHPGILWKISHKNEHILYNKLFLIETPDVKEYNGNKQIYVFLLTKKL